MSSSRTTPDVGDPLEGDPRGGFIVTVYLCEPDRAVLDVNQWMREQGATRYGRGVTPATR